MTLPPLPPTRYVIGVEGDEYTEDRLMSWPAWDEESMRAYAEQAVAAERERFAAVCDQRSADHWRAYSDKSSPHFCDARFEAFSDEAEECATLIRGDNAKVSGAGTASAGLPG